MARLAKHDRLPSRHPDTLTRHISTVDLASTYNTSNCTRQNPTSTTSSETPIRAQNMASESISTANFTETEAVDPEVEIIKVWTEQELRAEAAEVIALTAPRPNRRRPLRTSPPNTLTTSSQTQRWAPM